MRVLKHVIDGREIHRIGVETTILDAARLMTEHGISSLPVVSGERLVGIITERDLVQRALARRLDAERTPVAEIMSRGLVYASPEDTYEDALGRMKRHRVRHLLVVDGARLAGVVSMRDLLILEAADRADEVELLTAYIHAVPPDLQPLDLSELR
ncbi:MAG TPA: CBS domain-containing protein [Polyangia bacterium]|jgi:CBS domain-containing protein